nr:brevican core protein-like isoform X2 [Pocillopora verrucosa]
MAFSKLLTPTLRSSFCLSLLVFCVLSTDYNRILIFKEPIFNAALTGHIIRTVKVSDDGGCRVMCYMEPNCVSFNVGPSDDGTRTCNLNNATDDSVSPTSLVDRPNFSYNGAENVCLGDPCPGENSVCQVGFTEKGFRCKFLKRCNEGFLQGEASLSGSCYKLITKPETWSNADAKCISLGAQLVKIESAFENDFLTQAFFKGTSGTYWIGLSDQVHEGKWIWTDGSSLGADDYSPWGKNNPNNLGGHQNCGQIVKGDFKLGSLLFRGFKDGEWNDFRCDFLLGYICEKKIYSGENE